jgi:DNA-binding FrmR family transcriptional regulator
MNEHNHGHIHEHGEGQTHAHLNIAQEPAVSHAHAHNSQEAGDPHAHTLHQQEGHSHHHVHSEEEKRAVINRLSRAIGHLESVRRMVERDEDCSDVLIQLAAVRNAINNTGKVIMKNHISHCIVDAIEEDDMEAVEALNRAIDRFIK